jgi:hypothetical protein
MTWWTEAGTSVPALSYSHFFLSSIGKRGHCVIAIHVKKAYTLKTQEEPFCDVTITGLI